MNISGYGAAFSPFQMQQQIQDKFNNADQDGSGGITIEELQSAAPEGIDTAKMESMFTQMDSNGDGEVTQEERNAMMQMMQDRMQSLNGNMMSGADSEDEDPFSILMEALSSDQEANSETKDSLNELMEKLNEEGRTEENMKDAAQLVQSLIPTINVNV